MSDDSDTPRAEVIGDGKTGKTVVVRATIMLDGQPMVTLIEVNVRALARALTPAIVEQINQEIRRDQWRNREDSQL